MTRSLQVPTPASDPVAAVVAQMRERLGELPPQLAVRAAFLGTYLRTTEAIGAAVDAGHFEDADWVRRWDAVFAALYLVAHDADLAGETSRVPRPWRLAFAAPAELPALRHVLLGINAHINYDLPQALFTVISPEDFDDPQLLERRRRDHERIDVVLSGRVGAEDDELRAGQTRLDKLLAPLNRRASKRFITEARHKVWHNVAELQAARLIGDDAYRTRLAELEVLAAARIADLLAPGQVLLRLAVSGFGVLLPPV
jgi:Family of unknown function (DUF5995)